MRKWTWALLAVGLGFGAAATAAEQAKTDIKLGSMTCREAWQSSGKQPDAFAKMLRTLANESLQQRQLQISANRDTGMQVGKSIIEACLADPEEHLSSVVDKQIRLVGTPAAQK